MQRAPSQSAIMEYQKPVLENENASTLGKRVLLVDDDLDLLLTYEALLQACDYRTCTAENGAQALKVIRQGDLDVILCDLDMPELSGDLLYNEVGRERPELQKRFVFFTGNANHPTYEAFLKQAKPPLLCKPVAFDCLLEKLRAVHGD